MSKVKQVIVIRRDLKMRRGKEIAQGSHSSIAFLTNKIRENPDKKASELFTNEEREWVEGNFAKICVQVENEKELWEIYRKAKDAKLTVHLITDAGLTEFGGVATKTCLCVGPHEENKFIGITDSLKLY